MTPKKLLAHLEVEVEMGNNYDEIQANKYRLEGARMMYELVSAPWRKYEQSDKRQAYRKEYYLKHRESLNAAGRKYYQEHKEELREYQRNRRAKKKSIDKSNQV